MRRGERSGRLGASSASRKRGSLPRTTFRVSGARSRVLRPGRRSVPYDYAGSLDHGQEATVLARLHADPPRFIVSLNRRLGFFMSAPSYYLLREFVHAEYAGRSRRSVRRPRASSGGASSRVLRAPRRCPGGACGSRSRVRVDERLRS
jgi:hypothetical protein